MSFPPKRLCLALCVLIVSSAAAFAQSSITVGSLALQPCIAEYHGYCGSITVPLDRTGGQPGDLTVGFEYYPHTHTSEASVGVILAEEGGPGYSTTGSRDGYVRLFTPLRTTRDILLIDKRGTGRSSAIHCPALQKAYLPTQADIADCANQLGVKAWFYRSADGADDVADVLSALSIAKVDYYGDSYGTWFGQVLAVLHPELLRTIVLDSAYPVLNDPSNSEVNHGQREMDLVCQRSAPCKALGSSATARFALLLSSLRSTPVSGMAPGQNGERRKVTADPAGLFLIIANAGNTPTTWRDLDAAARAYMESADSLPLLRLIAEARDSYSGGGNAKDFSVGLAYAVECSEYGANFNQSASPQTRQREYNAWVRSYETNHPNAYAPFKIVDAIDSQMDAEGYDSCLTWPSPPANVPAAQPISPDGKFPSLPVLVLSGELDTVTSPKEGRDTAALFPNATFIQTSNLVHESAISDGGVFVSPLGEDFSRCVGPIVRNFISSSGSTGDTSCIEKIRPIRTVPKFTMDYTTVAPVTPTHDNMATASGLVLASAVTETVGDALARYYVVTDNSGAGLRGGSFTITATDTGYRLKLSEEEWAPGLAVSGSLLWNQLTGTICADVTFSASEHSGSVKIEWNDRETEALARLTGTIDGEKLAATRLAP